MNTRMAARVSAGGAALHLSVSLIVALGMSLEYQNIFVRIPEWLTITLWATGFTLAVGSWLFWNQQISKRIVAASGAFFLLGIISLISLTTGWFLWAARF